MNVEEYNTVRRSDWRNAIAWSLRRPYRAAFVVGLLALAGTGSVLGYFRWQLPLLQWSFAAICWFVALALLARLVVRIRKRE
ncbi:hypothetical protein C7H79_07875 [Nitrosomonas supralitoralis]|uniref:Uncharacterized protein n=1 Tax=Nitrosomonas supralitoralis TaxID=2116706 RepID=A0A2P7NVP4_9PROT|nr:hypothetical protein C7H79_07875 [Nitrosomonas supralitoralis]